MELWKNDKKWADTFMPDIKRIIIENAGNFLSVEVSNKNDDQSKATDLVINVEGGTVAVRIRRDNCKWRDWTIRSFRNTGSKTELKKLQEGFAKWYLYIWTEKDFISDWILIDLDKARQSGLLFVERNFISNGDGTGFIAIGIPEIKEYGCLVNEFKKQSKSNVVLSSQIDLF